MELLLQDIAQAVQVMQDGGIILYPTDTVWGIGCDATNEAAVAKIFALKKRNDSKKMITLVASERDILQYVTQPDLELFNYLAAANQPTTVIYEDVIGLANNLIDANGSAAIRICQDSFCRHLIKRLQRPIVSTSANLSGMTTPSCFADIHATIIHGVDYVVQHRRDDSNMNSPSAIIEWSKDGQPIIIR